METCIRKEILDFARDMEIRLNENLRQDNWIKLRHDILFFELSIQGRHLAEEFKKADRDKERITALCADIANYAMMIADNEGKHL